MMGFNIKSIWGTFQNGLYSVSLCVVVIMVGWEWGAFQLLLTLVDLIIDNNKLLKIPSGISLTFSAGRPTGFHR